MFFPCKPHGVNAYIGQVVIKAQGATALTVENIGSDSDKKLSVKVQNLTLQVYDLCKYYVYV
jgi:hypothetical protein